MRAYRTDDGAHIHVDVIDNGRGLPRQNRQKLLEPYMTTREKGTGLGLAIVRKVMEDHAGALELHDAPDDFHNGIGALVRLVFPARGGAGVSDARITKEEPETDAARPGAPSKGHPEAAP